MATLTLFLTLLLLALSTPSIAQKCGYGQVKRYGKCKDCPPGTHLSFSYTYCQLCPKGTYNPFPRAPDSDACRQCLEDTFSPKSGAVKCKPCPAGQISGRGFTKCLTCGPGFALGFDKCDRCEEGFYSNSTNNRECTQCDWPLNGPVGSKSRLNCKRCPPGQFGSGCFSCGEGYFTDPETGLCIQCPPGTISSPRFEVNKCVKCPRGTYSVFARRRSGYYGWLCKTCPDGTTSKRGSSTCRVEGKPCKKGLFENKDGNCEKCRMGFVLDKVRKECVKCPEGSASLGGLRETCVKCTGELVPDFDLALCRCPPGRFYKNKKCFDCPAGTGGNMANFALRGRNGCYRCSPGSFQDKSGQPECKHCPFGTFTDKLGSTSCKVCPEGSVPAFDPERETERCATIETGCPIGYKYRNFWGSNCAKKRTKKRK